MLTREEELQSRCGCDDRYLGWLQCSMCGKRFLPENNGDGKSPCCTAEPLTAEDILEAEHSEEI